MIEPIFKVGDFIKNKEPYEGEGELMVLELSTLRSGEWFGYKCAKMKGKHVKEPDFKNLEEIDKWHQQCYEKVG